jgi:predicted glycoside hydrolase/deacetylase ChbG (UPF0249 family)
VYIAKRLIVNADGFGFGPGATQGVLDALREGKFISSISVNANFPDVERVREVVEEFPHVSIGVHLNPIVGKPCLPLSRVPSLVGPDGFFHAASFPKLLRMGSISHEELQAEFDAQITKVKQLAGDRLTHLDSQANRHLDYFDLFLTLARKWELKRMRNNASLICLEASNPNLSRLKTYLLKPHVWLAHQYRRYQMAHARRAGMRMADDLITVGYAAVGNKANLKTWLCILRNLPPGTHEIYCHPAYPDETLRRWSYYQDDRAMELDVLRGESLRQEAKRLGVEIISFHSI